MKSVGRKNIEARMTEWREGRERKQVMSVKRRASGSVPEVSVVKCAGKGLVGFGAHVALKAVKMVMVMMMMMMMMMMMKKKPNK